jgi:hypothetical protein
VRMSATITVRVDDEVLARLRERARLEVLPPASLAQLLLVEGLDRRDGVPARVDGPLVTAVQAELAGDDPIRREALVLLARQAEAGAAQAGVRLLAVLRERYDSAQAEYERLSREMARELSTPVFTYCQGCRELLPSS